jgi:hypothetical protein
MTYFSRLAHRFGQASSPRHAVTPIAGPAAVANAPGHQSGVGDLESLAELPVSGASAPTTAESSLAGVQVASMPFEPMSEVRPRSHEGIVDSGSHTHGLVREATAPTPREWVALDAAIPQQDLPPGQQPAAPPASRGIALEVASEAAAPIASDVSRPNAGAVPELRARSQQVAAVEPAIQAADSEIEVLPRAETPVAANKPRTVGAPAAAQSSPRVRAPQPLPETDEDNGAPAPRVVTAPARSRDDRDTASRRPDRTATPALHAPAGRGTGPVEVRIGAVTLQVHTPATPSAPPAPVRSSFAPHRHYLRTW